MHELNLQHWVSYTVFASARDFNHMLSQLLSEASDRLWNGAEIWSLVGEAFSHAKQATPSTEGGGESRFLMTGCERFYLLYLLSRRPSGGGWWGIGRPRDFRPAFLSVVSRQTVEEGSGWPQL